MTVTVASVPVRLIFVHTNNDPLNKTDPLGLRPGDSDVGCSDLSGYEDWVEMGGFAVLDAFGISPCRRVEVGGDPFEAWACRNVHVVDARCGTRVAGEEIVEDTLGDEGFVACLAIVVTFTPGALSGVEGDVFVKSAVMLTTKGVTKRVLGIPGGFTCARTIYEWVPDAASGFDGE